MSKNQQLDSVFELKRGFLVSQVQVLSRPLLINHGLQNNADNDEYQDISAPALEHVAAKLNAASKKHQQLVYSSVAIRHVAEQLEALYAQSASESGGLEIDRIFTDGLDLTNPNNINALPDDWLTDTEGDDELDEQLKRYRNLVANLSAVRSALASLREKHSYYSNLLKTVSAFANPQENVQSNLVTRNGDLAQELNRTRILASRLSQAMRTQQQTNQ